MHQHPTPKRPHSPPQESSGQSDPAVRCRPFLKYVGGKQRLLLDILQHLPKPGPGSRHIEPFLGAGSILLNSPAPACLAGDANPDLMALWVAVQARPTELIRAATPLFRQENCTEEAYRRIRDEFNHSSCRFDRATRLLYLNRFGFNGLFRVNRAGDFNVPFGRPAALPQLPEKAILRAAERLKEVMLHCSSFEALLSEATNGDVVYCDPPYLADASEATFTSYTGCGFGFEQHRRLLTLAEAASARGAVVAISNHDNPTTRELYSSHSVRELRTTRTVAASTASRGCRSEVLVLIR